MGTRSKLGLAILFALTSMGAGAMDTKTYSDHFPNPDYPFVSEDYENGDLFHTDWGNGGATEVVPEVVVGLRKFDPDLGALTSTTMTAEVSGEAFGWIRNNVSNTTFIEILQNIVVEVDLTAVPAIGVDSLKIELDNTESFVDLGAGETGNLTPYEETETTSVSFNDLASLMYFVDDEPDNPFVSHNLEFPVWADGEVQFGQNTGNMESAIETLAGARGSVTYTYLDEDDFTATMNWWEGSQFWFGTIPEVGETCQTYAFTARFSCDDGAEFVTDGYTLPEGCKVSPGFDEDPFFIECEVDQELTNNTEAEHQIFDFPDVLGDPELCSVNVTSMECNGFELGGLPAVDPIRAPTPGGSIPEQIPALAPIGLALLGGLLGLLGIRRFRS